MKYKKLDYNTEDLESLSSSNLQKIADYALRRYLLNTTDNNNENYYCPLKQRWYPENKMHVAHYHDRHRLSTRYSLYNCFLISEQSNMWESQIPYKDYKSKHHYEYEIWLHEKLGEEKFEDLVQESKKLVILNKTDYINIINNFRSGL